MTNLFDLSIVVPSFNRQLHAFRQMWYWSNLNSLVTIYVLDGTSRPIISEALEGLDKNIHYYHMPFTIEERFGKIVDLINTKYVTLLSDDEFFIPSALEECINRLEEKNEFVGCTGRCLRFYASNAGILAFPIYSKMKNYQIIDKTGVERMFFHMNNRNCQLIYCVYRTEAWKNCMRLVASQKRKFSTPYLLEIGFELSACYQGKIMTIDDLMLLRNAKTLPVNYGKWNLKTRLGTWANKFINRNEIEFFFSNTASILSKIDGNETSIIKKGIKKAVAAEFFPKRNKLLIVFDKTRSFAFRYFIPVKLKMSIQGWKSLLEMAKEMEKSGVNVNFSQLKRVTNYIGNHEFSRGSFNLLSALFHPIFVVYMKIRHLTGILLNKKSSSR